MFSSMYTPYTPTHPMGLAHAMPSYAMPALTLQSFLFIKTGLAERPARPATLCCGVTDPPCTKPAVRWRHCAVLLVANPDILQ